MSKRSTSTRLLLIVLGDIDFSYVICQDKIFHNIMMYTYFNMNAYFLSSGDLSSTTLHVHFTYLLIHDTLFSPVQPPGTLQF